MQMTVEEIIRNYTESKDKAKQIGILADLNGCDKEKIRSILRTRGVELPTKGRPKKEQETIKTDFSHDKMSKTVTIKNLATGEVITKSLGELVAKKDEWQETKPVLPAAVRSLIQERIGLIAEQRLSLDLEQEELENFLRGFAE